MADGLNFKDLRETLNEFDTVCFSARTSGWDSDPRAERAALVAARGLLAEIDQQLADRVDELDDEYGDLRPDEP